MEPAALTPREILGLLAEEDRLRVVSALVLGATTSAEVAAATGMTVRETGRALARLAAGGLVESGPDDENASVLGRFIRGDRLTSIPVARGKRLVVLGHLAGLFEPGRRYTEAEVNHTLGAWHPDYAALRRYLVDEGFLRRADGTDPATSRSVKHYWRAGGFFDVDEDGADRG